MRVVLVRHSEAAAGHGSDADRPLTPAGEAMAAAAARGLAKLEPAVSRVVTSPAVRAHRTGQILARAWSGAPVHVDGDLAIGAHPERAVARVLAGPPETTTLIVGHAPDLAALASLILGATVYVRFECCAAACIELDPDTDNPGTLEWAMGPAALAAVGAV